jgi:cell division protein FtsI (penicillin-binding protein 3)
MGGTQRRNNVAAPVFREIADKIYARNIEMHEAMPDRIIAEEGIFPVIRSGNVNDLKLICNDFGISNHVQGEEPWVRSRININAIEWRDNKVVTGLMPDVTGMSLRDALFILENQGLRVKYEGKGRVINQSLSPGRKVVNGNWINLKLG